MGHLKCFVNANYAYNILLNIEGGVFLLGKILKTCIVFVNSIIVTRVKM